MISEAFLKRVLLFIGVILSGLITLIFISTPDSLEVPVPDQVPSIVTKSSLTRDFDEAKTYFESSVAAEVPGASLASLVSWSPNGKYVVANMRFTDPTGSRTRPYVLNFATKKYTAVPHTNWIDYVSWAGSSMAYATEKGFAVYDIERDTGGAFGGEHGNPISTPVISFDGSYVAYSDGGISVYSTKAKKTTRLSSNTGDIPLLWQKDNKTLVVETAGNGAAIETVPKNSTQYSLATLHIGTRVLTPLVVLPQNAKQATWVVRDQLALLTLGSDAGSFDYSYNFSKNTLKLLAETSEGIAFTTVDNNRGIVTLKGNKVTVYDGHAEKINEVKRVAKSRVVLFAIIPNGHAFIVREKVNGASENNSKTATISQMYEAALFNFADGTETYLADLVLPYAIIAPNGKVAATIEDGNGNTQFIEIDQ